MKVNEFEELIAWQKSQDLTVVIYETLSHVNDFRFRNQIFGASVSISNNIAEGFEKNSNKVFSRFLKISKGSCGEVRSMLHLAERLRMISNIQMNDLIVNCREVSKIIGGLIKSLKVE